MLRDQIRVKPERLDEIGRWNRHHQAGKKRLALGSRHTLPNEFTKTALRFAPALENLGVLHAVAEAAVAMKP
jgi:hypothetical protein